MQAYYKKFWIFSFFLSVTCASFSVRRPLLDENPDQSTPPPSSVKQKIKSFEAASAASSASKSTPSSDTISYPSIKARQKAFETGSPLSSLPEPSSLVVSSPSKPPYSDQGIAALQGQVLLHPDVSAIIGNYLDEGTLAALRQSCRAGYAYYTNERSITLDLSHLKPRENRDEASLINYLRHHPLVSELTLQNRPYTQAFIKAYKQAGGLSFRMRCINLGDTGAQECSLFPLQIFSNLKRLNVSNKKSSEDSQKNKFESLFPFLAFPCLQELDVSGNPISDVSDAKDLPLCKLRLNRHALTQEAASGLQGASSLSELSLENDPEGDDSYRFQDVSFLSSLDHLTQLNLAHHSISQLPVLSRQITYLDLGGNQLNDLEFTQPLSQLEILCASHNRIASLEPLRSLKNLRKVMLGYNLISSLDPLSGLGNLGVLEVGHNNIRGIDPLKDLTNLEVLRLNNNPLSSVSPLADVSKMHFLDISSTSVSSFLPLVKMVNLIGLYAEKTNVSDLGPVALLRHLQSLYLSHNQNVRSVAPLGQLHNLCSLYLDGVKSSDFSILKRCKGLESLHLNQTGISDLGWLSTLPKLTDLYLENNNISHRQAKLLKGSPSLEVVHLAGNPLLSEASLARLRKRFNVES